MPNKNNKASKTIHPDPTFNTPVTTGTTDAVAVIGSGPGTNKILATLKSRKTNEGMFPSSTAKSEDWEKAIAVLKQRMSASSSSYPKKCRHKPASNRNPAKDKSPPRDKYFVMDDISLLSELDAMKMKNEGKRVTIKEPSQDDSDVDSYSTSSEEDDSSSIDSDGSFEAMMSQLTSEGSFEAIMQTFTCNEENNEEKPIRLLSAAAAEDDSDDVDRKQRDAMLEVLVEKLCLCTPDPPR